ncbi:hypothetical protein N0V82_009890 [Gnomoniopsis sp. IMI 355080]|nr:hypothetical protein N0V82_009890 [Gnomoniopsis sp. IMI 355080]
MVIVLLGIGISLVVGAQKHFVGGHTLAPLSPSAIALRGKHQYVFWIFHSLDIGLIKLSLLLFFRRIFKGHGRRTAFDIANWTLIILTAIWTTSAVVLSVFECGLHPEGTWTGLAELRRKCVDNFSMYSGLAIVSWVLDIAVLIEPLVEV